jgi:hypothetical protein
MDIICLQEQRDESLNQNVLFLMLLSLKKILVAENLTPTSMILKFQFGN